MTAAEVKKAAGEPISVTQNRYGETDYRYFAVSIRLSASEKRVVEVGICHPREALIAGINILRSRTALRDLRRLDGEPFRCAEFVILPNLGLALQGFRAPTAHERVLTVLAKGRWAYVRRRILLKHRHRVIWQRLRWSLRSGGK